jgi:ABC-type Mn2+/Zn2+ transport system ATPase subunit/ABC-type uncharacterized transport system permease subunit
MISLIDHILYAATPYGFVALALIVTYRYLQVLDLTFASSFVVGPAAMAWLLVRGFSFLVALASGTVITVLLASFTILLILKLELDDLLAGLLASFAGFAITLLFTQGTLSLYDPETQTPITTPLTYLKEFDRGWVVGNVPLHPSQVLLFLVLIVGAKLLCDRFLGSEAGLAFRSMEDEKSAPNLLRPIGMNPETQLAGGILAGNLFCMASGTLILLKQTQITAQRGFDVLITVIAAYLLGTALFEKRSTAQQPSSALQKALRALQRFRPTTAALIGLLFYFCLLVGVSRYNIPASVPKLIVVGLIVASFVALRWHDLWAQREIQASDQTELLPEDQPFSVEDATIDYPGFPEPNRVVENASLKVEPETLVRLTGPNGSGKTTLLKYLAGRISGTGLVRVPTKSTESEDSDRVRHVGYIAQGAADSTCATLTPREHLALYRAGASASPIRAWNYRVEEAEAQAHQNVRHLDEISAGSLSGGQRQILNLTSLLVRPSAPQVVFLDEPLTYLDGQNAAACTDLIEELVADGRCVIIVQHDLETGRMSKASPARMRLGNLIHREVSIGELQTGSSSGSDVAIGHDAKKGGESQREAT